MLELVLAALIVLMVFILSQFDLSTVMWIVLIAALVAVILILISFRRDHYHEG